MKQVLRRMLNNIKRTLTKNTVSTNTTQIGTILDTDVSFVVNEAYNTLRTNLCFALATSKSNVLLVSSSVQGEGKSTTVANIAISMARTNARVVIIDSDMRRPMQHKLFKVKNTNGLSNLLGGMSKLENTVNRNVYTNLDLISAGTIPPNPSELVNSDNMAELIKELSSRYDYVIIDTPPINVVSDALAISRLAAGLVLVVKQNSTTYEDVNRVIDNINFAKSKMLGVVINNMKDMGGKGSYRYKNNYRYNYEYTVNNGKKKKEKKK